MKTSVPPSASRIDARYQNGEWTVAKKTKSVELKGIDEWSNKQLRAKVREQEETIQEELELAQQLRDEVNELRELVDAVIAQCGDVGRVWGVATARRVVAETRAQQAYKRLKNPTR